MDTDMFHRLSLLTGYQQKLWSFSTAVGAVLLLWKIRLMLYC